MIHLGRLHYCHNDGRDDQHHSAHVLFTDIESSTRLWDHFPEAMLTALDSTTG